MQTSVITGHIGEDICGIGEADAAYSGRGWRIFQKKKRSDTTVAGRTDVKVCSRQL